MGELHSWNEGLTKETDDRLVRQSESLSKTFEKFHPCRFTQQDLEEIISKQDRFDLVTAFEDYENKYQKLDFSCRSCGSLQKKSIVALQKCPVCFKCHPKG